MSSGAPYFSGYPADYTFTQPQEPPKPESPKPPKRPLTPYMRFSKSVTSHQRISTFLYRHFLRRDIRTGADWRFKPALAKLADRSADKFRHTRSVAYAVQLVLLNKHRISGGGDYLHCYSRPAPSSAVA